MHPYLRYALVALVVVAVVSLGVGEAVRWSYRSALESERTFDADSCDGASLSAYELRSDADVEPVASEDLAPAHRRAFDRALARDNNTVSIDPTTLPDLPDSNETSVDTRHVVAHNGTRYQVTVRTRGCYGQVGPPDWLIPVLVPFTLVDQAIRSVWQHLAILVVFGVGWWAFQRWARFGP